MSSFTRTIPAYKTQQDVEQILSLSVPYVPLTFNPRRAQSGDFIYLVYHGSILARARITAIEAALPAGRAFLPPPPPWAKWLVLFTGGWQLPPRRIPVQGHQGVRYLHQQSLEHLDAETW